MNYLYSPYTKELITSNSLANWASITNIVPPSFNPATEGCFFRDGIWVIEIAPPPPPPSKEALERLEASQYQKLKALKNMSPTQVSTWVDANINTFADAKDALKTLAIAVGILARDL